MWFPHPFLLAYHKETYTISRCIFCNPLKWRLAMNIRLDDTQNINDSMAANTKAAEHMPKVSNASSYRETVAVTFDKDAGIHSRYGANAYKEKKSAEEVMMEAGNMDTQLTKDYMTVMSNTLSDDDYKKLSKNGYDPGELEPWETVTIVDEIKATMAKSGVVIEGYNDNLDSDKLAKITGSQTYANKIENQSINSTNDNLKLNDSLEDSFAKYDVPYTKENIKSANAALDMAKELTNPQDGAVKFMTENAMEPTISNMYTAGHAGATKAFLQNQGYFSEGNGYMGYKAESEMPLDTLNKQLIKVIENAGYEANEEILKDATNLVKEGIPVTEETIATYENIKDVEFPINEKDAADAIARSIKLGRKAGDANLTKSARVLEEVRLHLTIEARYTMEKAGVNADVDKLARLVEDLKEAENRQFEALFGKSYALTNEESGIDKAGMLSLFNDTNAAVSNIESMHIGAVGLISLQQTYSIKTVSEVAVSYESAQQPVSGEEEYEKIGDLTYRNRLAIAEARYEMGATEVRSDLGDRISNAFRNIPELLKELGIEATADNQRAARILGYNQMEISASSIEKVNETYDRITNVIDKMKPSRVLDLIRSGENPLELSMEELEKKLDVKELSPKDEAERYSHFLYRMDKNGDISEAEKQSFIGIYRMIHNIEKNDGAAIGTLMNMQGEINFKNLLSAVRTRHNKGMDLKVDDGFGALEDIVKNGLAIDDEINVAFENALNNNSNDSFANNEEASIIREEMEKAGQVPANAVEMIIENHVSATNNNLLAGGRLISNRGNFYKKAAELSDKSTKSSENVDNNVDNDSFIEELFNKVNESFDDEISAKEAYNDVADRIEEVLSKETLEAGNSLDVREIAMSFKELHVARSLANEEWYEVPMEIGGEITSVSVKIRSGNEKSVGIYTELESIGKIGAKFTYEEETIDGFVMCESGSFMKELEARKDDFISKIAGDGVTAKMNFAQTDKISLNILTAKSDKLNNSDNSQGREAIESKDAINTKTLYRAAKEFLRFIK